MWQRAFCTKDCPDTRGLLAGIEDGRIVTVKGDQLTSQRLTDMVETRAFHCNLVEVQPQGN
jgi:hypothetical protein